MPAAQVKCPYFEFFTLVSKIIVECQPEMLYLISSDVAQKAIYKAKCTKFVRCFMMKNRRQVLYEVIRKGQEKIKAEMRAGQMKPDKKVEKPSFAGEKADKTQNLPVEEVNNWLKQERHRFF